MAEFLFSELLPLGLDATEYRLVDNDGVRTVAAAGRTCLEAAPGAPTRLASEAMRDIARDPGTHLPAQLRLGAAARRGVPSCGFLLMAKGGGPANKSFLYQETKAVLNPAAMTRFLDEKLRALGTAACPPYHLAVVVGGTS